MFLKTALIIDIIVSLRTPYPTTHRKRIRTTVSFMFICKAGRFNVFDCCSFDIIINRVSYCLNFKRLIKCVFSRLQLCLLEARAAYVYGGPEVLHPNSPFTIKATMGNNKNTLPN